MVEKRWEHFPREADVAEVFGVHLADILVSIHCLWRRGNMEAFDIRALRKCLNTRFIGRELRYCPEVNSTNALALRLAAEWAVEGTVVLAEAQSKGRGRAGKSWYSPPGLNLYLSVILRPAVQVQKAALLTLISSLAIADAIDAEGGQAQVKWPNDVLLAGRKVAGVGGAAIAR